MSNKQQNIKVSTKKKIKKIVNHALVYVQSSFNNTLVYITDLDGNTLSWATSGGSGFKGSKKSTPYAAQIAAKKVGQNVKDSYSVKYIEVYVKGPGPGREAAVRALAEFFKISAIHDITGIPHNGCRGSKERRT